MGNIIQCYDTDKMFPAFGFGGKLPTGQVSHNFPLNAQPTNPYCHGIPAIIAAYIDCVKHVCLWGPTNFAPNLRAVMAIAAEAQAASRPAYFIQLIITDGARPRLAAAPRHDAAHSVP